MEVNDLVMNSIGYYIFVTFIVLLGVLIYYKTHTLNKIDNPSYSSQGYSAWTQGVPVSATLTIKKQRVNKKVYLSIKNTNLDINVILPIASTLKNNSYIDLTFCNDRNHVQQTFYFFEDEPTSIFRGTTTYYINSTFRTVKLKVVNGKWTVLGAGKA
jgi:hypothetical protein